MSDEFDNTIWGNLGWDRRSAIKEHANRVYQMGMISRTGGTEAGQHADTGTSVFNNKRSMDWAVWKLLIALRNAGYNNTPQQ